MFVLTGGGRRHEGWLVSWWVGAHIVGGGHGRREGGRVCRAGTVVMSQVDALAHLKVCARLRPPKRAACPP